MHTKQTPTHAHKNLSKIQYIKIFNKNFNISRCTNSTDTIRKTLQKQYTLLYMITAFNYLQCSLNTNSIAYTYLER